MIQHKKIRLDSNMESKTNKHIPINKGHFDLDTPERIIEFQNKMSTGWENSEYKKYRNAWKEYPKKRIIRDYPIQVDLELSSFCNLNCPMCYRRTKEFHTFVDESFMEYKLFKRIIDEVANKVYAIRLSWRGESMMHPEFLNILQYVKQRGVKEVSFLTNASKLDMKTFQLIAEAGADWITISADGIGDMYNTIRKPLLFNDTFQKIKDIAILKKQHNLIKPVIKLQTIWPAIKDDPEVYYKTYAPYVDLIAFNPLIDYLGKDDETEIVYELDFICPQLYQRIFVASDGNVMMCNSDEYGQYIIGNAYEKSIHEIWHGSKLNEIRSIHKKNNGFKELEICRRCFYPRKTKITEKTIVEGREIFIENYINRKQIIGE